MPVEAGTDVLSGLARDLTDERDRIRRLVMEFHRYRWRDLP